MDMVMSSAATLWLESMEDGYNESKRGWEYEESNPNVHNLSIGIWLARYLSNDEIGTQKIVYYSRTSEPSAKR